MKKNRHQSMVRILAVMMVLATLVAGTVSLLNASITTVKTAFQLFGLNDDIRYYNDAYNKSDDWTAEVEELFSEREEKFYNSDDIVVRTFSNSHSMLKVVMILLSLAVWPMLGIMWLILIARAISVIRMKKRKSRR